MRIRTQLALSFLAFTIIPLSGLTLYSYYTSIQAFKKVVKEEYKSLAKEMGGRMEQVTRDLQHRLDRLDRRPFDDLRAHKSEMPGAHPAKLYAHIMDQMGDMALLVNSLEFPAPPRLAPGRDGENRRPQTPPPPPPDPSAPALSRHSGPAGDYQHLETGAGGKDRLAESVVVYLEGLNLPPLVRGDAFESMRIEQENDRIVLKCDEEALDIEIKQKLAQAAALVKGMDLDELTTTSREAVEQVRQAQSQVTEARRKWSEERAARSVARDRKWAKAKMEIFGSRPPEAKQPAAVAGPIKAEIRGEELLARIFEQGRFRHGEIQFAIDKAGNLHTPKEEQAARLQGLGFQPAGQALESGRPVTLGDDWIVATVHEPASSMTFGIARPIGNSLRELRMTALRNLGIGTGFIALALLGIIPLSGRMTRNLSTLTQGVEKLSKGDLDARVPVRSGDEIGQLAAAFNQMAAELGEQQKRLVEQERLQKELEMCRRIQEILLPREPLSVGFAEAQGISLPARQVGGDFFNYFVLPDGDVAVLMGDVSGKGVPAALLMANLQASLQAKLQVERDLARLAAAVDVEIAKQTEPQTFATLFIGIISRDGLTMRWVNAGHNPQFILSASGSVRALHSTGKPVGLLPGDGFEEKSIDLHHGDFLFLYTDGLVEAADPGGEEFGTDRLESILVRERDKSIDRIVATVVSEVREHRAGAEAGDDATLLALKVA
jgi:serine phosphatase RsbU (regulator of sigma subunit)